jgi:hypothetical protein
MRYKVKGKRSKESTIKNQREKDKGTRSKRRSKIR